MTARRKDPRTAAIEAIEQVPIGRRQPERLLGALTAANLRVDWAPDPQSEADGATLWVECAMCGRWGSLVVHGAGARVVHPPVACALPADRHREEYPLSCSPWLG